MALRSEARELLRIAAPVTAANLLERGAQMATIAMVGRLGPEVLGPVSLANSVNQVFGTSVCIGLSLAASTLTSQAHGANDPVALGLVLERAVPINLLFSLPAVVLLLCLGRLLLLLGMEADFAQRGGAFALTVLPVAMLAGTLRAMQVWLSAQGITRPALVLALVMLPLQAALCWLLVFRSALGFLGAGVAMSVAMTARCAALYAYICTSPRCKRAWAGFTREALRGWSAYLRLAIPGVYILSEFWVGEGLLLSAARLPSPAAAISALAIYQLANVMCYQPPAGVRVAVNTRVGSALGAGQPAAGRTAMRAALRLVLLWVPLPLAAIVGWPAALSRLFTSSAAVEQLFVRLAPWLAAYVGFDAALAVANGTLSGCGQQKWGGRLALMAYVGLSLPLALGLGFGAGLGAVGLMAGHVVGKLVHTSASLMLVARVQWAAESERALARVARLSGSTRDGGRSVSRASRAEAAPREAASSPGLGPPGSAPLGAARECSDGEGDDGATSAAAVARRRDRKGTSRLLSTPGSTELAES